MTKKIVSILLGLTTLLALAGCDGETDVKTSGSGSTEVKTYRIGTIGPLSGDAASYGIETQRIMDYRLAEINKEYANKGAKFELVYEDGKCDGAAAAAAFQKLTDVDGIKLIIGGGCSSETLGFLPMLEDKGVVALSFLSSNPELEGKSKNFFTLSYSDSLVGAGLGSELGKYKKVDLITEQNDYNIALRKVTLDTLAKNSPDTQIVLDETFPKGSTDLRDLLAKVNASDAEAILINANPGVTTIALVKQLAEIKDFNKKIIGQVGLMGQDAIDAAPSLLEGAIVVDAPNIKNKDFEDYLKKITDAKGPLDNIGPYYAGTSLDCLNIMTSLAAKEDGDPQKVRDDLATGTFSGWIAPSYSFNGKTFVRGVGYAKYVIKNGKTVLQ